MSVLLCLVFIAPKNLRRGGEQRNKATRVSMGDCEAPCFPTVPKNARHTHTHTRTHTHTHTPARAQARRHEGTQARTHARAHARTHARTPARPPASKQVKWRFLTNRKENPKFGQMQFCLEKTLSCSQRFGLHFPRHPPFDPPSGCSRQSASEECVAPHKRVISCGNKQSNSFCRLATP